jgi:FkbM family methyltransferase
MEDRMEIANSATDDPIKAQHAFLLSRLAPSRMFTVLDIGANPVNVAPYRKLLDSGGCHVVGFEPQEDAYQALIAAAGPNESYIKAAVGKPGKALLHLYPSSGMVSIFPLHIPALKFVGMYRRKHRLPPTVEIELKGVDEINEITHVDMLKMDVQGAELEILISARKKLAQAVVVIPELRYYRLYEKEPILGEVDNELRAQGFELHKFLQLKRRHIRNSQTGRLNTAFASNQLLDGDAVYIRRLEDPSGWSDDQLRFLALASATVFNSQDLALRCLDLLVERGAIPEGTPADYLAHLPAKLLRADSAPTIE